MEVSVGDALGFIGEPHLWRHGYIIRDLDVAALARLPRHTTRYEGRSRPALS